MAAGYFKNMHPFLAVNVFCLTFYSVKLLSFRIKDTLLHPPSSLLKCTAMLVIGILEGRGFFLVGKTIAKNGPLFFAKCFAINFLVGAVLKTIVWKMDSRVKQAYDNYFKVLEVDRLNDSKKTEEINELSKRITCDYEDNLVIDVRRRILPFLQSIDLIHLRLTSKAWLKAIGKEDFLIIRIKENFSEEFIEQFRLQRLVKLLSAAPVDKSLLQSINTNQSFYDQKTGMLTHSLKNKTLVWGKAPDYAIFLCFKHMTLTLEKRVLVRPIAFLYIVEGLKENIYHRSYYFEGMNISVKFYKFDEYNFSLVNPNDYPNDYVGQMDDKAKVFTNLFRRISSCRNEVI
jgi:hypothetical protein